MTAVQTAAPEFKRGLGLKFKFSLAIIVLIAVVMGGVTEVVRNRVQQTLLEQILVKGGTLARGLAANAAEAVSTGDSVRLTSLVDQALKQEKGITVAAVVDAGGVILAHSDFKLEGQPYPRPADARNLPMTADNQVTQYLLQKEEVLDFAAPVMLAGLDPSLQKQIGAAHVVYSLAPLTRVVNETLQWIFYVAGAGLLLGMLFTVWLVNRITRPIRRLADAAKAIGGGNLDLKIPVKRHDELGMLSASFNHMASDLKNAQADLIIKQRLQNEMEIAQRIQGMLVPKTSPKIPGYSISMFYRAAEEVSGDYFDFINIGKGLWGMAVADVSGKGVPGALVMAQTRSVLRSIAPLTASPAKVLSRTNLMLYKDLPENMFVTISYLVLDTAKRSVNLSRGGHLAAVIYRKNAKKCEQEMPTGIAIGISEPETFDLMLTERTVKLEPGDFILMYTDGVDEATNSAQELFGNRRLLEALTKSAALKAAGIVDYVQRSVEAFVGAAPQADDITMILVKVEEGESA
jgi:serine phosphatase RsbU (regulator of sigma subunit)